MDSDFFGELCKHFLLFDDLFFDNFHGADKASVDVPRIDKMDTSLNRPSRTFHDPKILFFGND